MITEIVLAVGIVSTYRYFTSDKYKFNKKLESICKNNSHFSNKSGEILKLVSYEKLQDVQDGFRVKVKIPDGISASDIEGQERVLSTNLNATNIDFNFIDGLLVIDIIAKPLYNS
jgi:hypothetical protein